MRVCRTRITTSFTFMLTPRTHFTKNCCDDPLPRCLPSSSINEHYPSAAKLQLSNSSSHATRHCHSINNLLQCICITDQVNRRQRNAASLTGSVDFSHHFFLPPVTLAFFFPRTFFCLFLRSLRSFRLVLDFSSSPIYRERERGGVMGVVNWLEDPRK